MCEEAFVSVSRKGSSVEGRKKLEKELELRDLYFSPSWSAKEGIKFRTFFLFPSRSRLWKFGPF